MPESLTFRFIDGGGGAGDPSGGSPTASQFARRDEPAAPTAPGGTSSDRVEDRQAREPARADKPTIPRVDEPSAPAAPKAPTVLPPAPAAPVAPTAPVTIPSVFPPEARPEPPSPFAPATQPIGPLAPGPAQAGSSIAGLFTTGPQAAFAASAVAAGGGLAAARAAIGTANKVVENIAPFSPGVARVRAIAEARQVQQAVRLADEIGPAAERFEAIKSLVNELSTELFAKFFELYLPATEAALTAALRFAFKDVPGAQKIITSLMESIERQIKEFTEGGDNVLFDRQHLEPPGFEGDVFSSGRDPGNAPAGLEFN